MKTRIRQLTEQNNQLIASFMGDSLKKNITIGMDHIDKDKTAGKFIWKLKNKVLYLPR